MKALCWLLFLVISSHSINNAFVSASIRRQLGQTNEPQSLTDIFNIEVNVDVHLHFPNLRLKKAYFALQEWKKVIHSDPHNMIKNWDGIDVCSYNGVVCAKSPDDPSISTVAGIDLNRGDIEGQLPPQLGLLTDLSMFHINTNKFSGNIPNTFSNLAILNEFDISNNQFAGTFPNVVLYMPKLKYLDIRFNNFQGLLPPQLFDKDLDAIFLNNNRFSSNIPENLGNSNASVIVFANNELKGCIPKSIGQMANLDEVIFANNQLSGCLPKELGLLHNIKVLDLSNNDFVGCIPHELGNLKGVEKIDISHNQLIGSVVDVICTLPKLVSFRFKDNYFNGLEKKCEKLVKPGLALDHRLNCLPHKPDQKHEVQCLPVVNRHIDCESVGCYKPEGKPDQESKRKKPPNDNDRGARGSIWIGFRT
ncbi:pollen-specific leucine-rich repeat extensin-like protein 1 [Bidens hawaiensis]|uniref:pollen-specific leucine-rich repeat extensin-like protein 1 n=1 Tax=Bidens hawaiensis TaxID=980011 RepID=UPI00404AB58D